MSMRKRIFLIHMLMLIGGMAILFAVIFGSVRQGIRGYMDSGEWISNVEDDAKAVLEKLEKTDGDWEVLAGELKNDHCALVVYEGDQNIYPADSADPPQDRNMIDRLRSDKRGIHTAFGNTYVDADVTVDGHTYYVAALFDHQDMMRESEHMEQRFSGLLWKLFLLILLLILMGWAFSRYLVNRMMEPLDLLMDGLKRTAAGDLEHPVDYHGDAELESVCLAFNQMQETIRTQKAERQQYEQSRTDMITSISHDLRTPLTSVKGYIKAVLDGVPKTPEMTGEYLKIAYDATGDMDRLLQKLFLFSKVETGQMPLHLEKADLETYLLAFAEEHRLSYEARGMQIKMELTPGIPAGYYDLLQLERVLVNLLENSLRYAKHTPLVVTIRLGKCGSQQVISVSDNGVGVPPEKLPHIFERFYRCDEARSREGSGIGLYIVKYIVEAHGGQVQAVNDNGLTIRMSFPERTKQDEENTDRRG